MSPNDPPSKTLRSRVPETLAAALQRRPESPPQPIIIEAPPTLDREDRHFVPPTLRATSEWVWRSLVIGVGILALLKLVSILSEVVFPVVIAVLLAALLEPVFRRLNRFLPRGMAAGLTVLGTLAILIGLFSFVVNQFAGQFGQLTSQVGKGIEQIRTWIASTFNISDGQITTYADKLQEQLGQTDSIGTWAATAGLTAGHAFAAFAIALFALFFFLYDGPGIWAWVVRLFPRPARARAITSGRIAWGQLQAFTRATILVAGVDAAGIGIGAFFLGVPFASGIALLVFIGAFVPVVGALVSGFVAVVLALVAKGPVAALAMLGVVVAVQQLEAHVLQPILLGRAVRLHPLGVILAIATGVIVGGIFGALVAVPLAAVLNAVGHNLLDPEPDPPTDEAEEMLTPEEQAKSDAEVEESEDAAEIDPPQGTYST